MRILSTLAVTFFWLLPAVGQSLHLSDDVRREESLSGTTVSIEGRGGLIITGTGDPLSGSIVDLRSEDTWLRMTEFTPSQVSSTFLSRVRIAGVAASGGTNARVVQYGEGAIVLPQGDAFLPLEVFSERYFAGTSKLLSTYTHYNNALLGETTSAFRSFRLKRGYMVTFSDQENGSGTSRCYVAADGDLEIGRLPSALEDDLHYVRVFPWRWVTKKGVGGNIESGMGVGWSYNWNIDRTSPVNWEYVPIRQTRWWPGLDQDWRWRGATHILGYNEPDRPDQANLAVGDAIWSWPDVLWPGLRAGAPAVSDGGLGWLYDFMNQADAAGLRVDYVPVHYYRCYGNNNDPAGVANQFYDFLKGIYDNVQRPLWVTEWNNGANWTGCADPTFEQQALAVAAITDMLDNTPFVERYAIYNWVEDVRRIKWDDGWPTQAGQVYRDNSSPIAYRQEMPETGIGSSAAFSFDGHSRDASTSAHAAMLVGAPKFTAGKHGQSLAFDGENDWVQLSPRIGNSTDWTFAGWVCWNGGGNWQRILSLGVETDQFIFLTPRSGDGTLRFGIQNKGGQQRLNAPALPTGTWTHVAVTISGDTGKLFVNGQIVDTNTSMTVNPNSLGTKYNYLGKSRFPADPLFSGRLDEIRFFSSAQSDSDIAALASTPPPAFVSGEIRGTDATAGQSYTGTLAHLATGSGTLTFSKLSGVSWLSVSSNGYLSGLPSISDAGENSVVVRVSDSQGSYGIATLYVTVANIEVAVSSSEDDAEEFPDGSVNLTSSDLELVNDGSDQIIGIRFAGVDIPYGAIITSATVQFAADETQSGQTDLVFQMEASDDAAPFTTASHNISARPLIPYALAWQPNPWVSGQTGLQQQTPNIAGLVQEVVTRPGWRRGNALALIVSGSGHRTAEAFDNAGGSSPVLKVSYVPASPVQQVTYHPVDSADDAEQSADGSMYLDSTDLELVDDGGLQSIGIRFPNIAIPTGAVVVDARLQFTADEAQSGPTNLNIHGHDTHNAVPFTAGTNNISSRLKTSASVSWNPAAWDNIGERGPLQQSPDLSTILNEIIALPGWASGNAIAFIIDGSGHRTADSTDKTGGQPVSLTITYSETELPGGFSKWLSDHPGASTATGDPDHDGNVNLIEYAFGLNPWQPDAADMETEVDSSWIHLTYTRPSGVTGVTFQAEWSDTLNADWSAAGVIQEIIADNGTTRTIRASVPRDPEDHQRYLRVRVAN